MEFPDRRVMPPRLKAGTDTSHLPGGAHGIRGEGDLQRIDPDRQASLGSPEAARAPAMSEEK